MALKRIGNLETIRMESKPQILSIAMLFHRIIWTRTYHNNVLRGQQPLSTVLDPALSICGCRSCGYCPQQTRVFYSSVCMMERVHFEESQRPYV